MAKQFEVLEVDGNTRPATERENYHLNKIRKATLKNKFYCVAAFTFLGLAGIATLGQAEAVWSKNKIDNIRGARANVELLDKEVSEQTIDEAYKNVMSNKQYEMYSAMEQDQKENYIDDLLAAKRKQQIYTALAFAISMMGAVVSNINGKWNNFRKDLHIIDFVNDKKVDKTVRNIYGEYQGMTIEDYLAQYNLTYVGDASSETMNNELFFADEIDYDNLENNERDTAVKRQVLDGLDAYLKGCEHGEKIAFPDGYVDAVHSMIKHTNLKIEFEDVDRDEYLKEFGLDSLSVDYEGEMLSYYTDGRDTGYVNGYLNGYIACMEQFKEQLEDERDIKMVEKIIAGIKKEGEKVVEEVEKMHDSM